jgi:predicted nucleic acid-binding protein
MDENAEEKQEIFIDSNIFLYSYSTHKLANRCNRFLLKIEEVKFKGFVTPIVVDEVFYKSIVAEVMTKKTIPLKDISSYIKSNPSVLKTLKNPYEIVEDILSKENIDVLDSSKNLGKITYFVKNYTLLPSDALIAATCSGNKITKIATFDKDFERVDFLEIIKP